MREAVASLGGLVTVVTIRYAGDPQDLAQDSISE